MTVTQYRTKVLLFFKTSTNSTVFNDFIIRVPGLVIPAQRHVPVQVSGKFKLRFAIQCCDKVIAVEGLGLTVVAHPKCTGAVWLFKCISGISSKILKIRDQGWVNRKLVTAMKLASRALSVDLVAAPPPQQRD